MASNVYIDRQEALRRLGFRSYQQYLNSNLWAGIRAVKLRAQGRCEVCSGPPDQVHHRSYEPFVLEGRGMRWLVVLCSGCHTEIHRDGRTLQQANQRLNKLLGKKHQRRLQRRRKAEDKAERRRWMFSAPSGFSANAADRRAVRACLELLP